MSMLVMLIAVALVQLILALHVRNTLRSSAHEGAVHAAKADRTVAEGAQRAKDAAMTTIGGIPVSATAREVAVGSEPAVEVTLSASVPIVGLWGPGDMSVTARAFSEGTGG